MSYSEDQLLPISALQHLLFCERQCALIHVEQVWAENHLTILGQHLHRKAHQERHETQQGVRAARGLALCSHQLGLVGKADVVEFHADQVIPVEYKRGRPKRDDSDRVQLCAQAMCLEEMLSMRIASGEIFYGQKRRRVAIEFDQRLRDVTSESALRLHQLFRLRETPKARREPKCESCSLVLLCLPGTTGLQRSASQVFDRFLDANLHSGSPESDDYENAESS